MSGLRLVDDTAYDATSWNDVVGLAPSKNAVRDRFEAISGLVTVANEAADTTSFPLFATQATGSLLAIKSNAGLTFNAATGLLGATGLTVGSAATINGLDVGQKGAASVRIADASGMASLSSGGSFVAVGHGAGDATTTGSNWVAVGINSLEYSTAGNGSVALGAVAGSFHADGVTHLTATTDSVYLGKSSRGFDNTDSNTIVIGANAIGEGANKTTIGTSSTTDFHAYGTPKFGGTNSLAFSLASLTAARTLTAPDVSGTLTVLGNASTGSGSVVLATSPTLVTPTLSVTTINLTGKDGLGTIGTLILKTDAKSVNDAIQIAYQMLDAGDTLRTYGTTRVRINVATAGAAQGQYIFNTISSGTGGDRMAITGPDVTIGHTGTALGRLESRATSGAQIVASNTSAEYLGITVGATGTATYAITTAGTARHVFSNRVNIPTATPASASATGTTGDVAWDASYIYVCTATNAWKRVAIATW